MSDDRWAGLMLIMGSAGVLMTLGLHPSGHDLFSPATYEGAARKLIAVHSLGLLSLPLWFAGAVGFSRSLGGKEGAKHLSLTALVFYGFGLAAMMIAVVFDGLVSPGIVGKIISASSDSIAQGWKIAFNYNALLDQAFINVMLVATSVGVALWATAIWRASVMPRVMSILGALIPVLTIVALISGQIGQNPHLFMIMLVGQVLWFGAIGVILWRQQPLQAH